MKYKNKITVNKVAMEYCDNNSKSVNTKDETIKFIYKHFCNFSNIIYFLASIALTLIALSLIILSSCTVITSIINFSFNIQSILNAVSYVIISIAIFDISKSLIEEEIMRDKELRLSSEARKTLTKFSVVIIIAIALESLVFVIKVGKENIQNLLYPCALILTSAIFMLCLAVYQKLSVSIEHKQQKYLN